ncbi:MAG TPA: phospholipase D-like domain-containing protein [Thermoanaerobaculia bacterium]|nr:phospholipase D-like domain-containing protein [Thermoanaerobaculia bacterium]
MIGWIAAIVAGVGILTFALSFWRKRSEELNHRIEHRYGVEDAPFVRAVSTLLGPTLLEGNRVSELVNGDRIFPAMLDAIRRAGKTITFETFIYWEGEIGREFAEALSERARSGVRVHVLLDWVGTQRMDQASLRKMRDSGVEVCYYRPLRWWNLGRMNNRTHRKILVVDGKIGFTGGVGIADAWLGDAEDSDHWRDTHFQVEGPVVGQMQAAFIDNWSQTREELLHGDDYFPELAPAGGHAAQMFTSSPEDGTEKTRLLYLLSVASARRTLRIATAYFVPDALAVRMLCDAQRRGVEIDIVVPGPCIDAAVTRRASRALWGPLLDCGIAISEYQPTMYHSKVMIVDGIWTSLGSTNFDNRSFKLNDEANLNVRDRDFARRQEEIFAADLRRARRITWEEWRRRPLREKALEWIASLLRRQL